MRCSGPSAGAGTQIMVRFAPTATAADMANALADIKGEIVGGPKPGGMFEVRISKEKLPDAERDAIIAKLKANKKLITLILPKG